MYQNISVIIDRFLKITCSSKTGQIALFRKVKVFSIFPNSIPKSTGLWWFREVKDTVLVLKPPRKMETNNVIHKKMWNLEKSRNRDKIL